MMRDPVPRRLVRSASAFVGKVGWFVCLVATLTWATPMLAQGTGASNAAPSAALNPALVTSRGIAGDSKLMTSPGKPLDSERGDLERVLRQAADLKAAGNFEQAEQLLLGLTRPDTPKGPRKTALLELAVMAQERKDLAKAQQVYAQFLKAYFQEPEAPEVLLRQGLIYREMGAPIMALSKFYAVMSSALHLKPDRLEYYRRLVLRAQCEIAETYFLQGKHEEAAEFYGRLLKLNSPELDQARIHLKLLQSLSLQGRHNDVAAQAAFYLDRYPQAPDSAEARFLYAQALRKLGRNREAVEQVAALLNSRGTTAEGDGPARGYWQQRTGNELANQFYHDGDYVNALEIYRALAACSSAPEWRVPALYQVGLVYERLQQAPKAVEIYEQILSEPAASRTSSLNPSLTSVLNMAKWRKNLLHWQQQAEEANRALNPQEPPLPSS